jgi:hypothetical protein
MIRSTLVGIVALAATAPQILEAQRRAGGTAGVESRETVEIGILAGVGARDYTSRLPGTCRHQPSASIYDVPAALYMVQADGTEGSEIKRLSLTLWRPKDGSADQLSLALDVGSTPVEIEINPRERARGAATVQVHRSGPGGKLEVRGKDAAGTKVSVTISCPVFAGVVAEGG